MGRKIQRSVANRSPLEGEAVSLMFLGSGAAALIYELVWFHQLRLVIGGEYVSLAILLATFMGGMCLGSLALPRFVSPSRHPLRVYAALELALAAIGASLPHWLPALARAYFAWGSGNESPGADLVGRSIVGAVALLPATMLMGATLPAIAMWVRATPQGMARLGAFYGANTLGAVLGCVLGGFVLLPYSDAVKASYFAAAVNVAVAAWALALARRDHGEVAEATSAPSPQPSASGGASGVGLIYLVAALSGFAALGSEVVWTRLLALLLAATVYTFSIILAIFLAGIGVGGIVGAQLGAAVRSPLRTLAACQLGAAVWAPIASYVITRVLPYWPPAPIVGPSQMGYVFLHDSLRAAATVLVPAVLWGMSFPLALAAAGREGNDGNASRLTGQMYAANTLGAILGALVTGAALIPWLGTARTQRVLVVASGAACLVALAAERRSRRQEADERIPPAPALSRRERGNRAGIVGALAVALLAAAVVVGPPPGMLARALIPKWWGDEIFKDLYVREGRSTPVVVQESNDEFRYRYISVAGKVEASTVPKDLRCQRLLGHVAALVHPAPKRTLTVGMGAGTTAGCFVLHPEVEEIAICELEPAVPDGTRYFAEANHHVLDDERTRVSFDDARHYLAATTHKFDVITSDPIHPWVRGSAALYSVEYFEMVKRRLNPGGVVVQWIPFYESDKETIRCELATFLAAFPRATLWTSADTREQGYDIIAVGQTDERKIDLAEVDRRIRENARLEAALAEVDLGSIGDLFAHYAGSGAGLREWLAGATINRDDSLRLEYIAGMSLHSRRQDNHFRDLVTRLRYPSEMVTNDEAFSREIRRSLGMPLVE